MPKFKVVFNKMVRTEKEVIIEADNLRLAIIRAARQTDSSWMFSAATQIEPEQLIEDSPLASPATEVKQSK